MVAAAVASPGRVTGDSSSTSGRRVGVVVGEGRRCSSLSTVSRGAVSVPFGALPVIDSLFVVVVVGAAGDAPVVAPSWALIAPNAPQREVRRLAANVVSAVFAGWSSGLRRARSVREGGGCLKLGVEKQKGQNRCDRVVDNDNGRVLTAGRNNPVWAIALAPDTRPQGGVAD